MAGRNLWYIFQGLKSACYRNGKSISKLTGKLNRVRKREATYYGKEEEDEEEKIPLTERNSSKIQAAQKKVAVPGCVGAC
jgi:hypothetical protein